MTELQLVLSNVNIKYKGLFEFDELMTHLANWARQHEYDPVDKKIEETVTEEGKKLVYEHRFVKVMSTTLKKFIKIRTTIDKMTEVKEIGAIPKIFQKGAIDMYIDAWIITDWQYKWRANPWQFFLRTIINKYVKKLPAEIQTKELDLEARELIESTKAFLSLYRYKRPK